MNYSIAGLERKIRPIVEHELLVVCVPVYNEEAYLEQTLTSLQQQSFSNFRVLISDNASSDGSAAIAQSFCDDDERFTLYIQEQNIGGAGNFNFLRAATDSKYIMWLGAHDLLMPDFLDRHIAALELDDSAALSYSHLKWIDEEGVHFNTTCGGNAGALDRPLVRFLTSIRNVEFCVEVNHPIRRSYLDGEWFTLNKGTDRLVLSHLARQGRFICVPEQLYLFRYHRNRTTSSMERLTGSKYSKDDVMPLIRHYQMYYKQTFSGPLAFALRPILDLLLENRFLPFEAQSWTTRLFASTKRAVVRSFEATRRLT